MPAATTLSSLLPPSLFEHPLPNHNADLDRSHRGALPGAGRSLCSAAREKRLQRHALPSNGTSSLLQESGNLSTRLRNAIDARSSRPLVRARALPSSKSDKLQLDPGSIVSIGILPQFYGSYCYSLPKRHSARLYKLVKHSEDYMLSKVDELTSSNFVSGKEGKVHGEGGNIWRKDDICLSGNYNSYAFETSVPVDLPYSLSMLLELVADKNWSVVFGVAGASYRDMLMSWACRLRHLEVTNFLVCALDHETYKFAVLQGLPVFRDQLSPKNVSFDDCHFGTKCFQQVTKVKSRIVQEILRMGYNVLLSDVDVYWFHNPLPYMYSLGPATLVAESDEYNETEPINLPRRLNSGFYFAHSDNSTIIAMEMVVKHAANSGLSEQPSFYDILCGKDGAYHIGNDKCLESNTNLTLLFLNRDQFPNEAYKGLWKKQGVQSIGKDLGCFTIHNNWVNGRKKKLRRQMSSGLWDYDPSSRLCLQDWSDKSIFKMMGQFPLFEDIDS